jgi:hypothetical protein
MDAVKDGLKRRTGGLRMSGSNEISGDPFVE